MDLFPFLSAALAEEAAVGAQAPALGLLGMLLPLIIFGVPAAIIFPLMARRARRRRAAAQRVQPAPTEADGFEYRRRCRVCGKIYCYNGAELDAALNGGRDFASTVGFGRCPGCRSADTEEFVPGNDGT